MKFLLAQVKPDFNVERNLQRLLRVVEENDADIYIFPELYLSGYTVRDDMPSRAIARDSHILKRVAGVSEGKVIIFGFPERAGHIYNSAAVVHDSRIEVARKMYLPNFGPFEERLYFKEGGEVFIADTRFGRIGVQICYDAFFPEVAKIQAMRGAEIIVNISASPITSRAMFEKVIPARAIENTVFFAYVNWAGLQRTMEFWGGSMLYSPRGELLCKAPYFEESLLTCEADLSELEIARRLRPTLRDTRADLFPAGAERP